MASRKQPHVLVIPWSGQGHISPSLALAKCLASKGLQVTLVTTTSVATTATVTTDIISDGSEDVAAGSETLEAYYKRFRTVFTRNLTKLIEERRSDARAIIYDSVMPWVQDIAQERGLLCAPFFTQSCAVAAVFHHLRQGAVKFPYEDCTVRLPALPALHKKDMPSVSFFGDEAHILLKHLTDQLLNLDKADWIFFNTFHKLESEIIEWMSNQWPTIKTVGPTFLLDHMNDQKKLPSSSSSSHTIRSLEPKQDGCTEWLDSRETGSVVYVSFGSIASLRKEQMEEVAHGLAMSNCYFLWVVRSSETDKLPQDFNSEKGLIVGWCNQQQVLGHGAIACFMTHCGWNSTLEALSYGVPLIAMAQWMDQNTNAKFIEDVWGVGVRVKGGENGIVGREEIAARISEVVGGDHELNKNGGRWKELAVEAVQNGGSSANNIDDFVSKLIFSQH